MSFGYSVGDAVLLTQIAWKTVQNARKACGEHDELTKEVLSLHIVLGRLEQEYSKAESPLNHSNDTYKEELQVISRGCERVLSVLNTILEKYNRLSEGERSWRKLWQKIKFGNGQVADLQDLRSKMITYTSAMSLFLNMVSLGSVGRIEQQMSDAGGELQEIKLAIHGIAAHLISKGNNEGSVLTSYTNDDKSVWKEFRRELRREGFASSGLKKNKTLIVAYIKELGDRGLFDDDYSGDLKSIEDFEASNAQPQTESLSGENRPKSSSAHQTLLTVESTSAVLHKDHSVSELGQHVFLSSDDITNTDSVSGNVHDARLTMKLSKDDKSEQCLAGTSEMTSVSEVPIVDSKALDGTDIPLKRKPLQSYAESAADDELTDEFDDTEPFPGSQVTPVNVSCTADTPTSHGGPAVDPIEFVQTNRSASNSWSTRSQGSITRTPSNESMDVKSTKYKGSRSKTAVIATFYAATNGFCVASRDLCASSLLDRFEDRVHIIIDCQQVVSRFWDKFELRLNQFVTTANVIISNINVFLPALVPNPGYCKCYLWLVNLTSQPFRVGILSLLKAGSSNFEDVRDILINVDLWIRRFDENCGSLVFFSKEYLTSKNFSAMQHPRNVGLRKFWATPSCLRSTTISMEGTYQRPAYFSLNNEGPTSPELLREIRCLAEQKQLQSSVPSPWTECLEQLGSYEGSPQLSESGDTEGSSDYSDRDIAPVINDKGNFVRRWLRSSMRAPETCIQGPADNSYNGGWCRDADLNLQPWIDVWCAGDLWMARLAVDAIWHNYHEKIAPACIVWIKVRGNFVDLRNFQKSIGGSLRLLSMARDSRDKGLIARLEELRIDLSLMSQTLEDLRKDRLAKVLDTRSPQEQRKRVWLSVEYENSFSVPIIKIYTGEGCAACETPSSTISNIARTSLSPWPSEASQREIASEIHVKSRLDGYGRR